MTERTILKEVATKADQSPVTAADVNADALVRNGLRKLYPGIPMISEESSNPPYADRRDWQSFWLIDPLDGTQEYIAGRDEYTVNIALIRNGVPVVGVVHAPARGLVYLASQDGGTSRWDLSEPRPVRIFSKRPSPGDALAIVESRSHPSPELESYLQRLNVRERIRLGSSLKFGLLAEGRAQFYPRLGPTIERDVAAGGAVFRYSGRDGPRASPLRYNQESLRNDSFVIGLD